MPEEFRIIGSGRHAPEGEFSGEVRDALAEHDIERVMVEEGSTTETFVALRAEIANDRWRGVPILLRTGKAMAEADASSASSCVSPSARSSPGASAIPIAPTSSGSSSSTIERSP